jgi:hypothetical protein
MNCDALRMDLSEFSGRRQSAKVRGSPKRGSTLLSKRVIAHCYTVPCGALRRRRRSARASVTATLPSSPALSSGLWFFDQDGEGWEKILIDESGFNHSVYVADLDDGDKAEIDVGSEDQHELRRYRFGAKSVHANRDRAPRERRHHVEHHDWTVRNIGWTARADARLTRHSCRE